MSVLRFPHRPESIHPHYKWNENEYIIRMLNQNMIGIGLNEDLSSVTVLVDPNSSKNTIAKGPVDFVLPSIGDTFLTDLSKWIMIKEDGSMFYELAETITTGRPQYNQYLHGWYTNNGDRAIIFIDPNLPPGNRAVLMDSFNCLFEYEQRIPDLRSGEVPLFEIPQLDIGIPWTLTPGAYRFHLKGGRGGNGGISNVGTYLAYGNPGSGVDGGELIFKLALRATMQIIATKGSNGNNGGNGVGRFTTSPFRVNATCGGGGASGSDTSIQFSNGFSLYTYGGAGGGGGGLSMGANSFSPPFPSSATDMRNMYITGGGGGGGGFGIGGNGSSTGPQTYRIGLVNGGGGGRLNTSTALPQGGTPSGGSTSYYPNMRSGEAGQSHSEGLRRRNGGSSPANSGQSTAGPGGSGGNGTTNGYLQIYKIRDFPSEI